MEAFPGVTFAVHYSRHHMKTKNGKPPRPKFHVLFPIDLITDATLYAELKKILNSIFPYFDTNALDSARFLFGTSNPQIEIYPGRMNLTEFLQADEFDINMPEGQYGGEAPILEGSRNATLSRFAGRVLKKYGNTEKARECFMGKAALCSPPLDDSELATIMAQRQTILC